MRSPERLARQIEVLPSEVERIAAAIATARGVVLPEAAAIHLTARLLVQRDLAWGLSWESGMTPRPADGVLPVGEAEAAFSPRPASALIGVLVGEMAADHFMQISRLVIAELGVTRGAIARVAAHVHHHVWDDVVGWFASAPPPTPTDPEVWDMLVACLDVNDRALIAVATAHEVLTFSATAEG